MEEVEDVPEVAPVAPVVTAVPAAAAAVDAMGTQGLTVLQKGLFLAVILGCLAVFVRMNRKSNRGYEKSMA